MDWTAGRLFLASLGAVGAGLLVRQAVKAFQARRDDGIPELPPPPMPIPASQPRMPPPEASDDWWESSPGKYVASVEQWRDVMRQHAESPQMLEFLMSWLNHESKGNPCSWGFHGLRDPADGKYKFEAGIGQQYFAADTFDAMMNTKVHGIALSTLRAPCDGQRQTRPLTEEEKHANVVTFIGDVKKKMTKTDEQLAKAGVSWPREGADYWKLVKLQHGLPCIPSSFFGPAAAAGRTTSFSDFAAFVQALPQDDYTRYTTASGCGKSMKYRFGKLGVVLANAEKTGGAVVHG